jgi:hypothetical protein
VRELQQFVSQFLLSTGGRHRRHAPQKNWRSWTACKWANGAVFRFSVVFRFTVKDFTVRPYGRTIFFRAKYKFPNDIYSSPRSTLSVFPPHTELILDKHQRADRLGFQTRTLSGQKKCHMRFGSFVGRITQNKCWHNLPSISWRYAQFNL